MSDHHQLLNNLETPTIPPLHPTITSTTLHTMPAASTAVHHPAVSPQAEPDLPPPHMVLPVLQVPQLQPTEPLEILLQHTVIQETLPTPDQHTVHHHMDQLETLLLMEHQETLQLPPEELPLPSLLHHQLPPALQTTDLDHLLPLPLLLQVPPLELLLLDPPVPLDHPMELQDHQDLLTEHQEPQVELLLDYPQVLVFPPDLPSLVQPILLQLLLVDPELVLLQEQLDNLVTVQAHTELLQPE